MAIILSIETSTPICSVALHQDGKLLFLREIEEAGAHAEKLMGLIESVLGTQQLSVHDLDAIAVSEGPGSYTGLRIGVSTAKGLAFAGDLNLLGVSTLKALALGAKQTCTSHELIISMLDARRMEVYREIYDAELNVVSSLDAEILDQNSYQEILQKSKVCFVGDAVTKVSEIITHPNAKFLKVPVSADLIGQVGFQKYKNQEFESLAYFVPNYLKEFKALQSKKNPLFS
jgi:tRNA threonylcarbamoyladenosine biosynthesis protein TsaB